MKPSEKSFMSEFILCYLLKKSRISTKNKEDISILAKQDITILGLQDFDEA